MCPCHGSVYDTAARIRKGPAPKNLYLIPYEFLGPTKVKIG
jgi:ubiquinol-cytochrome c reductase iron-sulfur subunit